jgi:hypothetical protein
MVLLAFVAGNALLILLSKSDRAFLAPRSQVAALNWIAPAVGGLSLATVMLVLYQPWLAAALQLRPLDAIGLTTALACGVAGLLAGMMLRWLLNAKSS